MRVPSRRIDARNVRSDQPSETRPAEESGGDEPRLIRCQAIRNKPRYPGERCNGFVHRGTRELQVHSVVPHSDEAPRELDVVGCIRCGALHVLEPAPGPASGTRVREPP